MAQNTGYGSSDWAFWLDNDVPYILTAKEEDASPSLRLYSLVLKDAEPSDPTANSGKQMLSLFAAGHSVGREHKA